MKKNNKTFTVFKNCFIFLLAIVVTLCCTITSCQNKYRGPPYEQALYQMLDTHFAPYCRKNKMQLIHMGDFTYPSKRLMFGLWFRSYSSENLDEGRKRAFELLNDFVTLLQDTDCGKTYFKNTIKYYENGSSLKLDRSIVGLKIAYWDKNVIRPKAPHLAEIDFYDDKFYFYEADPVTQGLHLICEESYEETMQKLNGSMALHNPFMPMPA